MKDTCLPLTPNQVKRRRAIKLPALTQRTKQALSFMPFGKYKQCRFCDIPEDYLNWLLTLRDISEALRAAVQHELTGREKRAARRHDYYLPLLTDAEVAANKRAEEARYAAEVRAFIRQRARERRHQKVVKLDHFRRWVEPAIRQPTPAQVVSLDDYRQPSD